MCQVISLYTEFAKKRIAKEQCGDVGSTDSSVFSGTISISSCKWLEYLENEIKLHCLACISYLGDADSLKWWLLGEKDFIIRNCTNPQFVKALTSSME